MYLWLDSINLRWSIVYVKGSQEIVPKMYFLFHEVHYSVDPGEITVLCYISSGYSLFAKVGI